MKRIKYFSIIIFLIKYSLEINLDSKRKSFYNYLTLDNENYSVNGTITANNLIIRSCTNIQFLTFTSKIIVNNGEAHMIGKTNCQIKLFQSNLNNNFLTFEEIPESEYTLK